MFMSKHRVTAKGPAPTALALWLAVATLSLGFTAAPALADETDATEAALADADGQQPEVAEDEAATELDSEPAVASSGRPRPRVLRPDPSDVDDALLDSGFDREEAPAASGAEGAIACVAGCTSGDGTPPLGRPPNIPLAAAEAVAPSASGEPVCVAGC